MTPIQTGPAPGQMTPAVYLPETHAASILQQLQLDLAATHPRATLHDATAWLQHDPAVQSSYASLIEQLEAEHGEQTELEDLIQDLVAYQLSLQLAQRRAKKAAIAQQTNPSQVYDLSLRELLSCWQAGRSAPQIPDASAQAMLEIVRRALNGNQDAWAVFYQAFSALVQTWAQRHAQSNDPDDLQAIANDAWARFAQYMTPAKLQTRTHLYAYESMLSYLRCCTTSAAINARRDRQRRWSHEAALEEDCAYSPFQQEPDLLDSIWLEEVGVAIGRALKHEDERLLADLILVQGMAAREVCAAYPQQFPDAKNIYRRIRLIRERLQRNPDLLKLLGRPARQRGQRTSGRQLEVSYAS